ncbi:MAG: hypothetical protein M3142_08670 [Bacteroidota bacterium]|nr:hypothetical protein [Bacteroidota bacterium]
MKKLSAKRRKELYSLSSLLFHIIAFISLLFILNYNAEEKKVAKKANIYASSPEYEQYKATSGRIATLK